MSYWVPTGVRRNSFWKGSDLSGRKGALELPCTHPGCLPLDLSREGGKRRREPQQPFSERKQISAAGAEPGSHAAATSRKAPRDAAESRILVSKEADVGLRYLAAVL